MPGRSRATSSRPAARQGGKAQIDAIVERRDALVAEIARLRAAGSSSRFLENAQTLLTLWWSRSNWTAREQLLKSAAWQLDLARTAS